MSMTVIFPNCQTTRSLQKQVATKDGFGARWVPDGIEEITYEVLLDQPALHSMARLAAHSKGQKAVDGPLLVRVLNRVKIPPKEGVSFEPTTH